MKHESLLLHSRPLSDTITDSELFVDREKELEIAVNAIENEYNIFITGSKGSGKTSFLYRLKSSTENMAIIPVFCDMSLYVDDIDSFLDILLYSASNSLSKFIDKNMTQILKKTLYDISAEMGISILGVGLSAKKEKKIDWIEKKYKTIEKLIEVTKEFSKRKKRFFFIIDNLYLKPNLFVEVFGSFRDFFWQLDCNFITVCDKELAPIVWKPPVSSFFDVRISLENLTGSVLFKMLYLRGFGDKDLIKDIYILSNGVPRVALAIARNLIIGLSNRKDIKKAVATLKKAKDILSDSEQIVFEEILVRGSVSASDIEFQRATNQERPRLVQILRKLLNAGLLKTEQQGKIIFYSINKDKYPIF